MGFNKITPNTIIHETEGVHVIWFRNSRSFVLLEQPAWDVFSRYSKGSGKEAIVSFCQEKYGSQETDIEQFVNEIIQLIQFYNDPGNAAIAAVAAPPGAEPGKQVYDEVVHYQIGDKIITVRYQDKNLKWAVHPPLAHLQTGKTNGSQNRIDIFAVGEILVFAYNGETTGCFKKEDLNYFTGCVKQLMYSIVYDRGYNDWMMTLHASCVANNGSAVVFSAASGSGKSTLSALLKAHSFTFLADDFIVAGFDQKVYAFPAAISVKEGSYATLSAFYPELTNQAVQETYIGKMVQYLPVENLQESLLTGYPVNAFVFVNYDPSAAPCLEPVSKKEALRYLLQETWVNPMPENVESFFQWISETPFYRMQYSTTEQAIHLTRQIFYSPGLSDSNEIIKNSRQIQNYKA